PRSPTCERTRESSPRSSAPGPERSTARARMKLHPAFNHPYPRQSALVLGALVLASLFEGLGLTTLLPLLTSRVSEGGAGGSTGIGGTVTRMLAAIGLTPTVGVLLSIVVIGMVLKSVLVLVAN